MTVVNGIIVMFHKERQLFTDPQIDYPILNHHLSFADYIKESTEIISKTRRDLNKNNAQNIILANAPFELKPKHKPLKAGALLIHGLLDSPFVMKGIGKVLETEGFLVRAVLLQGHGTIPGALLNVDYHQWLETVRFGIHSLKKEVNKIFLVGFSTGADLALYHVLKDHRQIAGLILIAPALRIHSFFDFATHWYRLFRFVSKRVEWFHIDNEELSDYVKYGSIPFNAAYQVYRLGREIQKISYPDKPVCPLLFTMSENDATVSSKDSIQYFKQHKNPKSRMILYTQSPHQTPEDSRIVLRSSVYPAFDIVSFSHLCVPIEPSNAHYGENGDYMYASHLTHRQKTQYGEFSPFQLKINQFLLKHHWTEMQYERLTYNPDFEFLSNQILEFINIHPL